jgi:RHS repeat-associated protein
LGLVILLAAPDESSLAAKKKQRHVALKTATSTPKNRVWGFENTPLGRTCSGPDLSAETATGSVQYSYENASGRAHYYTFDHLRNVRELVNGSGTIVSRYGYDPYGNTTLVSGSNLATFQYAGLYAHQPSGLQLADFRTYNSTTGRWLSRDPAGEGFGGLNVYEYCDDLPVDAIDVMGLRGDPPRTAPAPQKPPAVEPKPPTLPGMARCSAWGVILYFVFECPGDTDPTAGKKPNGTHPSSPFAPGTRDPIQFPKKMNPGRTCFGGCNPCPPNSPAWEVLEPGHGGQTHWHWIIWEQNPDNCDCYSRRMSSPTKPDGA